MGFGNLSVDMGCEDVDWIHMARDRVRWRAVVNMVMVKGKVVPVLN
jgi:hypothetical protein